MPTLLVLASDIARLKEIARLLRKLSWRDLLRMGYVKNLIAELLSILERIVESFPSGSTGGGSDSGLTP